MEAKIKQPEEEKQVQKKENKLIGVGITTKILGLVLLFFTAFWTYIGFYDFLTFGLDITSFQLPLYVLSYLVIIALFLINKKGIYHKLIVSCGIIFLMFYVFMLVIYLLF